MQRVFIVLALLAGAAVLRPSDTGAQGIAVPLDYRLDLGLQQAEPVPGLRGFSVVLVQGDVKEGTAATNVPAAAARALADLKDFLPYKSYRLLDTQWTMGGVGRVSGRLRGVVGTDYAFELQARRGEGPGAAISVSRFVLQDETFGSFKVAQTPGRSVGLVPFQRRNAVIDTSFSMDVGETVVVGTSRQQGDTALIVLLTAVARTGAR